jgi:hypothetical protein
LDCANAGVDELSAMRSQPLIPEIKLTRVSLAFAELLEQSVALDQRGE